MLFSAKPTSLKKIHMRAQLWRQKDTELQARKLILFKIIESET